MKKYNDMSDLMRHISRYPSDRTVFSKLQSPEVSRQNCGTHCNPLYQKYNSRWKINCRRFESWFARGVRAAHPLPFFISFNVILTWKRPLSDITVKPIVSPLRPALEPKPTKGSLSRDKNLRLTLKLNLVSLLYHTAHIRHVHLKYLDN